MIMNWLFWAVPDQFVKRYAIGLLLLLYVLPTLFGFYYTKLGVVINIIWYDVISHKMLNSLTPNASGIKNMYTRFSWRYGEPNGIIKGLEEFKVIYEFVSNDKPIKKQKIF